MTTDHDLEYMRMALREARKGIGRTSPNPCVGAVIVQNGRVIAKGYHKKAGTPHAEIHALRAAGEYARGATLYVTLEPCNHTGKTPPCSQAVAAAGIARVVVGMEDPNPLVDGSGITYLRQRNIEVVSGVLEKECREINYPFVKFITTGLPWITMKAGVSLDGRLNYEQGKSGWITGPESGKAVHRLRNISDAIMIGSNTARIDNPSLTTRLPAAAKGRDPLRIILDRTLSLAADARPFNVDSTAQAWVFCCETTERKRIAALEEKGVRVFPVQCRENKLDLQQVFRSLGENSVTSVLVEGGAAVHGAILAERLYDYANLFVAPVFAGEGGVPLVTGYSTESRGNAVSLREVRYRRFGDDMMISGRVSYPSPAEY